MKSRKGFTLIELIVSIAIFGLIGVSMFPAFNTALRNIVNSGNRTDAVGVAFEDIINGTHVETFVFEVQLPNDLNTGSEKIDVEGNKITGVSQIEGTAGKEVEIFIYSPKTN
jgi:prepilin-type N-terminal cleavage/methylation domain-containing protein